MIKATPQQFAELLIPPVRERYIDNLRYCLRSGVDDNKEYTSDYRGFLLGVFRYPDSPEGREYWIDIYDNNHKYIQKGGIVGIDTGSM